MRCWPCVCADSQPHGRLSALGWIRPFSFRNMTVSCGYRCGPSFNRCISGAYCHPSSVFCSYESSQHHSYSVALCSHFQCLSNKVCSSSSGHRMGIDHLRSMKSCVGTLLHRGIGPCRNRSCLHTPALPNCPSDVAWG